MGRRVMILVKKSLVLANTKTRVVVVAVTIFTMTVHFVTVIEKVFGVVAVAMGGLGKMIAVDTKNATGVLRLEGDTVGREVLEVLVDMAVGET
jgi:hypothetical protein